MNRADFYKANQQRATIGIRTFYDRIASGKYSSWEEALTAPVMKVQKKEAPINIYQTRQAFYDAMKQKHKEKVEISYKGFCERVIREPNADWETLILKPKQSIIPTKKSDKKIFWESYTGEKVSYKTFLGKISTLPKEKWSEGIVPLPNPIRERSKVIAPVEKRTKIEEFDLYKTSDIQVFYDTFKTTDSIAFRSFRERLYKEKNRNENPLLLLKRERDRRLEATRKQGVAEVEKMNLLEAMTETERQEKYEQYLERKNSKNRVLLLKTLDYDKEKVFVEGVYVVLERHHEDNLVEIARWKDGEEIYMVEDKFIKKF